MKLLYKSVIRRIYNFIYYIFAQTHDFRAQLCLNIVSLRIIHVVLLLCTKYQQLKLR